MLQYSYYTTQLQVMHAYNTETMKIAPAALAKRAKPILNMQVD